MNSTPLSPEATRQPTSAAGLRAAHGSETVSRERRNSENNFWLDQLRFRRDRIKELISKQKSADLVTLLESESHYVDAMIYYREKHGGMDGLITGESPNDKLSHSGDKP